MEEEVIVRMLSYDKQHIEAEFSALAAMSDEELAKAIDNAAVLVMEGTRSYIEHMTCNRDINFSHLSLEATMSWQRQNFEFLCYEKMRRAAKKNKETI